MTTTLLQLGALLTGKLKRTPTDRPAALHDAVGSVLSKLLCVSRTIFASIPAEKTRRSGKLYMQPVIMQEASVSPPSPLQPSKMRLRLTLRLPLRTQGTVVRYVVRCAHHKFTAADISTPRRVDASNRVECTFLPPNDKDELQVCQFEFRAISTGQTVLKLTLTDAFLVPFEVFIPVKITQPMTDPALLPVIRFLEMCAAAGDKAFSNQATGFELQQLLNNKPEDLSDPSVAAAAWASICESQSVNYEEQNS